MHRKFLTPILLAGAVVPVATASAAPRVTVTRFHVASVAPGGDIAIAPGDGGDPQGLEFQSFAGPVAAELTRLGYRVVGGPAPTIAAITVGRTMRDGPPRSSFSLGIGGFTGGGGYHSGGGVGGGVGIPLGGSRPTQLIGTELSVRLTSGPGGPAIWEGRASEEVRGGTRDASPDVENPRLAGALFRDFPGESARTITVK